MHQLSGIAADFLALHQPGNPLLQPNAWDAGSARILASLGFRAIATTSGGLAASYGRLDGQMTHEEVLAHCEELVEAVDIPVAADYENGFADDPQGVAESVVLAAETGLAGCSIEDWSGTAIYDKAHAVDRIAAAAESAHNGDASLVLTARAENLIHGVDDLDDTIARLNVYRHAGADVLFAPGLRTAEQIKAVTNSVDGPVNVLLLPGLPSVAEASAAGAARISVGGSFAIAAYAALVEVANELQGAGTHEHVATAMQSAGAIRQAFGL